MHCFYTKAKPPSTIENGICMAKLATLQNFAEVKIAWLELKLARVIDAEKPVTLQRTAVINFMGEKKRA